MTDEHISYELGFSRCYVSTVKSLYPEKFEFIKSLDDNLLSAFRKYQDLSQDINNKLVAIWFELEDKKQLKKFSIFVNEKGIYNGETVFSASTRKHIFSYNTRINHSALLRYMQILEAYKEFKENK